MHTKNAKPRNSAGFVLFERKESMDLDRYARVRLASSRITTAEELGILSCDPDDAVRASVLGNSVFPPKEARELAARELSGSPSWVILQAMAGSPLMYERVYWRLAKRKSWYIAIALARNPRCPKGILKRFAAKTG